MKIRSAELKTVCGFTSVLPEPQLPEIAFAGRSNVGKSSLINALMQRKRLARVGETPGKTRTINFYEVEALVPQVKEGDPAGGLQSERAADNPEEKTAGNPEGKTADRVEVPARFCLVDLPGYGYANVPPGEKARWGKMIERYLRSDRDLRAVFLLLDIRHEPNANDRQMYDWIMQSGHTPVLIATKADKLKRSRIAAQKKVVREGLDAPKGSVIFPFSAMSGSGREEICSQIVELLMNETGE